MLKGLGFGLGDSGFGLGLEGCRPGLKILALITSMPGCTSEIGSTPKFNHC